jgi:hypothetical protein
MYVTTSPVARASALLRASVCPSSGSEVHHARSPAYREMISRVSSVEPPSTTRYSRFS